MATEQDTLETGARFETPEKARSRRLIRWLAIVVACAASLIAIAIIVLALNWPFTRQALLDIMQERSVRTVTIDRFHVTYFPPGCIAEGISFLHRKHKDKPPLITIARLEVKGSYWGMLSLHKRLSSVRLYGMHLTVPPSDPNGGPNPVMPLTQSKSGASLIIGTVVADGAVLEFVQRAAGKPPVRIVVHKLSLDGVGNDRPLNYRAVIYNPSPPGVIRSDGQFGTWNTDNPAETPVKGRFDFTHANLGAFKTIRGTLASTGSFDGALSSMHVHGTVDVPDFTVSGSSHTRDLAAEYGATVNATDGNLLLNSVTAHFDRTTVQFQGAFSGNPDQHGKAVVLEMTALRGRIEDLLNLFIESKRAPLTGNVDFATHFELPPGAPSMLTAMKIQGGFGVGSGKFTNTEIQSSLGRISDDAAKKDHLPGDDPETLVSNLRGRVIVENGVANLTSLLLTVPGAAASLEGTYSLVNYKLDLHGTLVTDGSASSATTGFKSFLLKSVTPFLKKKAGRQTVPFKITGNFQKVEVGLDIGHKK
jgi:hypothetical protein